MSMADRNGSMLDIDFLLKNGQNLLLEGVGIKVFDALRQSCRDVFDEYEGEPQHNHFDKRFIWGSETGVAVEEIAGWRVLRQYNK
jgi:hypothetical protein